jgi:predicted nucleotidyltransferase
MKALPNLQIEIPAEKIAELCSRNHVKRLAIFGSVLRKDFKPESDIDLLVEFLPETKVGFITFNRLQRELSTLLKRSVDLVPQDSLKPQIRQAVLQEAQVVYAN